MTAASLHRACRVRLRRWVPPATLVLAALAFGACALEAWQALAHHRANLQMAAGEAPPGAPAMVLLAQGVTLERQEDWEGALRAYAQAESLGGAAMAEAARMNAANIYLRQAIAQATQDGGTERAITLVELAKAGFRQVLRLNPGNWAARYNLELAQRLVPEYDSRDWRQSGLETEVDDAAPERAGWTEMVGAPRGMH